MRLRKHKFNQSFKHLINFLCNSGNEINSIVYLLFHLVKLATQKQIHGNKIHPIDAKILTETDFIYFNAVIWENGLNKTYYETVTDLMVASKGYHNLSDIVLKILEKVRILF